MRARANILGHSIHQMLIVFPLGLLSVSVLFDLIGAYTHHSYWNIFADYLIATGVIGGLAAALFGLIDWTALPQGSRAKRVGLIHAGANVSAVLLFSISWLMRRGHNDLPGRSAILVSMAGALLALVGGWLGGELVDRMGIGVEDGAHPNSK